MGEVELVDALLKAGVSVYESDAQANTALILAAKNGHADVCRLLKSQGADEHVRNAFRENAYDLANNSRRMDVLRVFNPWASDLDVGFQGNSFEDKKAKNTLCEPCDLSNGVTMLMLACRQGDIDAVREILDARQDDPLARTSSGCTALTMASEEGGEAHVHVVEELLRRCQAEYSFPVEYLLEQYLYSGRKTAMVLAATNGHLEVVKLLANARANINVRTQRMQFIDGARVDGDRRTVLHLTCMHGHHDVASFLIDNKADINATNYSGDTPLMLAARYGHSQVVKLLLRSNCTVADETMAPSWSSMHRACGAGHVDVAEALLEAHEEFVNHKDKKGLTPLMAAVSANFSEGAVILMNKGANVHERDHEGRSAVFYAAMAGQEKSLRVLLTAHNIQVDQPDSVGETPLMAACKSGHESTARLLLNAQANLEAPDDVAPNPLIIAAAAGHEPIVRMLLNNGAHRRKEKAAEEAMKASKSREGADVHGALNPTPLTRTDSSMSSGGTERFHKIIELLKREPMSP
uniref:Ankyrin repeat protein n=1 Tax=Strombidinopsis acuminata TaxID=141414 RepID=A0A7S3TNJ2_9SPIT